jgi:hypothetical protein
MTKYVWCNSDDTKKDIDEVIKKFLAAGKALKNLGDDNKKSIKLLSEVIDKIDNGDEIQKGIVLTLIKELAYLVDEIEEAPVEHDPDCDCEVCELKRKEEEEEKGKELTQEDWKEKLLEACPKVFEKHGILSFPKLTVILAEKPVFKEKTEVWKQILAGLALSGDLGICMLPKGKT